MVIVDEMPNSHQKDHYSSEVIHPVAPEIVNFQLQMIASRWHFIKSEEVTNVIWIHHRES